uniref:Olfactory receptor family 2 subfamily T member 11 n=1 Tax=Mandrillus leucophaeus TaxID=9568 RepID=A0A2K5YNJ0_MANLE
MTNTSSSDFTLPGVRLRGSYSVILAVFAVAVTANLVMIFLVRGDCRLYTPMGFLLSQLPLMDTLFIGTTAPELLVDVVPREPFPLWPFFLLGLMAYDRCVAVCNPLRYPVLMDLKMCLLLAARALFGGSLTGFLLTPITMTVPDCDSCSIDHFFCEIPAVLKLACADTSLYETLICCVLMLLIPISIISTSYSLILLTVHCMRSAEGHRQAFTTCSSHLTVVSIFYGAAFYTYVLPRSFHTPEQDKVVSASIPLSHSCSTLSPTASNKDITGKVATSDA